MYVTRKLGKSLQILELFPNFAKKIMSHERKAKIYNSLYRGSYELFAFWDKDKEAFVVATHGIVKKTQKTPLKEILKAEEIRKEYFNNK